MNESDDYNSLLIVNPFNCIIPLLIVNYTIFILRNCKIIFYEL